MTVEDGKIHDESLQHRVCLRLGGRVHRCVYNNMCIYACINIYDSVQRLTITEATI